MGFHEVPPKPFGHPPKTDSVRVRLAPRGRKNPGLCIDVYVSADVADRLGWRIGGRVLFLFGRDDEAGDDAGDDAGKLRLVPVSAMDRGNKLCSGRTSKLARNRLRVTTTRLPDDIRRLPPCVFDAEFGIDSPGELTVVLPFAAFAGGDATPNHVIAAAE